MYFLNVMFKKLINKFWGEPHLTLACVKKCYKATLIPTEYTYKISPKSV